MGRLGARLAGWWRRGDPSVQIMGRPAVWVVVAYLQVPAAVQLLTSLSPSMVIGEAGPYLSYAWAGTTVLAGALMVASWWRADRHGLVTLTDPTADRARVGRVLDAAEDERVYEVVAATLVAVLSFVYIAAAIETTDLVLSLTLAAVLAALATNMLGRSFLLLRQVAAIRRLRRERAL